MLLKDTVSDGYFPSLIVDPDWYEGKHEQESLPEIEDPVSLWRPAPERDQVDAVVRIQSGGGALFGDPDAPPGFGDASVAGAAESVAFGFELGIPAVTIVPDPGDDFFANVVLLLDMDGVDGATSLTDLSNSGHSLAADVGGTGIAEVDTAESKFSGTSAKVFSTAPSNGAAFDAVDSDDWNFGSGDFTIETHAMLDAIPGSTWGVISQWLFPNRSWKCTLSGVGKMLFTYSSTGSDQITVIDKNFPSNLLLNIWYHLAWVRNGSDFLIFLDGNQVGSSEPISGTFFNSAHTLELGANNNHNSDFSHAWFDNTRITKGVARYTANFTPPTAEYPDF